MPAYFACVLEGQCQGALLLSQASLQAMPRARKQETTSREGNCVCATVNVYLQDCMCLVSLHPAVWH